MASSGASLPSRSSTGLAMASSDLATITELDGDRRKSSSPEVSREDPNVTDPVDHEFAPKRRSTHPLVPFVSNVRPLEEKGRQEDSEPALPARANTFGTQGGTGNHIRRHLWNKSKPDSNTFHFGHPRRTSTFKSDFSTLSSVGSKFSVSFEDSAIWDQKAILSLGE